ncbi:MAG: tripartite tricarboxylate transporter TctB family protein [Tissierellia bacterium]|nr:tripartite tricarboxylate transporter TctB family protein [Tissierellia bacterium]
MKKDNKLGIALLILSAVFFGMIFRLPDKARLYPLIVTSILAVLTIIHLLIVNLKKSEEDEKTGEKIEMKQLLTVIIGSFIYIFLIDKVGYVTTTFLYVLGLLIFLIKDIKKSVFISLAFIIFIYILFKMGLKVPLPKGFLI